MDEFELIAQFFAPLATAPGAFGLKDDAAAIPARPGFDLIVTADQIAEGTDFFGSDPAFSIAQKALRVNLSDLAAKGAVPFGYLLALTMPEADAVWLQDFANGLAADQEAFGLSLLGGDTARGARAITVTAFGHVPEDKMIRRGTAGAGDGVYVTGNIGDSGGGLTLLQGVAHELSEAERDYLIGRYRVPGPPVAFGPALVEYASAAVDVSDGLLADLGHIAAASGVRLEIEVENVPRSPTLRALQGDGLDAVLRAVNAGDDYQIAFTANPAREAEIMEAAKAKGVAITRIGAVHAGEGTILRYRGEVVPVFKGGYRHF
jgi:thiamine-monophosphate kinase